MTASQDIRQFMSYVQTKDPLVEADNVGQLIGTQSYQRWMKQVNLNMNDLAQRGDDGLLINPDFNWCRVNGTTPTTQADGDNFQFIEQWAVFGATGNTYTITPTAYVDDAADNPSGSKFYPNFNLSALTEAFYIYNINYSPDFNLAQKFQNNTVALSMQMTNNQLAPLTMRFKAKIEGITDEIEGQAITIRPGAGKYYTTLPIPSLSGTMASSNAYIQFRLYLEDMGDITADYNINYIKSEISSLATNINVNHVAQKLLIDGL